jgi:osmotically-inducible protein OsmY
VIVSEGVVYLTGTVEDGQEKAAAEDDARTVQGVMEVKNDLDVAPHVTRTDDEIETELRRDLERNIRTRPGQIKVSVRDGIVYLDGTVDTVIQRWISEDMARGIPGAVDVINHLSIASA